MTVATGTYPARPPRRLVGRPPTDGLTPALQAALDAVRAFSDRHGRPPTAYELAGLLGKRVQSADLALTRLQAAGYLSPTKPYRYHESSSWAPAELEIRLVRALLREYDALLAAHGDPEDLRWDGLRRRARVYLDGVGSAANG